MDIIYVDEIAFRSAALDAMVLFLTARLLEKPGKPGRVLAAAALGGVYAALAALPPLRGLTWPPTVLAVSLGMARVAFGPPPELWRCWGVFLALSAGVAGAVMALARLAGTAGRWFAAPSRLLLPAFALCYAAVRFFFLRLFRQRGREVTEVRVALAGREAVFSALRDTGNALEDPLSGDRILVADARVLTPLFGSPVGALPEDGAESFRLLTRIPALRGRLRLVSYSAVGTERGLLPCFRADRVTADGEELRCLVAVSPTPVGEGEYSAIF